MTRRGAFMTRRRYRDVLPIPDDPPHTRGIGCWCQPSIEGQIEGDIIVHRRSLDSPRYDALYASEQGESDL